MKMYKYISIFCAVVFLVSCEGFLPETKVDIDTTKDLVANNYNNLYIQGMHAYDYLPEGYNRIDGAMLAAASDEADHALAGSTIEKFQEGSFNSMANPDNNWEKSYRGIRRAQQFLIDSENYEEILLRDISTTALKETYEQQCEYIKCLRAENNVMIAYIYFELLKRYGGVPIVSEIQSPEDEPLQLRNSYDEVVNEIVRRIDVALPDLKPSWNQRDPKEYGRIETGAALAIKARALLYAASPAYNLSNDIQKWADAADAAKAVIDLNRYSLAEDYRSMFLGLAGHQNSECILPYMTGDNDGPESANYPITTNGGSSGTCPSANLVDEYEFADGTPFDWALVGPGENPYMNRDPRLQQTIVVNGSEWNGRIMDTSVEGRDGLSVPNATTTGYYLKKFLTDNLDLELGHTAIHSWPLFRYAEVLLNFAEAMNEAYGPDTDFYGTGMTARWAVNLVRARSSMPPVEAVSQAEMREKIRHERRIELAFEEHRFWDVRRWGLETAKDALGTPLKGVRITTNAGNSEYEIFNVENRTFTDNMIYYPIPESEILNSNGMIAQNPGW